jgi:hypothetical protein
MQALRNICVSRELRCTFTTEEEELLQYCREQEERRTSREEDGEDALALKAEDGRGDRRNVQGELHASTEP